MRTQNLVADMKLVCGHTVNGEVKHNVVKAWCDECDESKHIEHVYVFRIKCNHCRFGRKDTNMAKLHTIAKRHAETTHHVVTVFNQSDEITGEVESGTPSML